MQTHKKFSFDACRFPARNGNGTDELSRSSKGSVLLKVQKTSRRHTSDTRHLNRTVDLKLKTLARTLHISRTYSLPMPVHVRLGSTLSVVMRV